MIDLKTFRLENNLFQKDVAEFLGVSTAFVSQIESGQNKMPADKLVLLLENDRGWNTESLVSGPSRLTYHDNKTMNGGNDFGASTFNGNVNFGGKSDEEIEGMIKARIADYEAEARVLRSEVIHLSQENAFLKAKYGELINTLTQIGLKLPKNLYLAQPNNQSR